MEHRSSTHTQWGITPPSVSRDCGFNEQEIVPNYWTSYHRQAIRAIFGYVQIVESTQSSGQHTPPLAVSTDIARFV